MAIYEIKETDGSLRYELQLMTTFIPLSVENILMTYEFFKHLLP